MRRWALPIVAMGAGALGHNVTIPTGLDASSQYRVYLELMAPGTILRKAINIKQASHAHLHISQRTHIAHAHTRTPYYYIIHFSHIINAAAVPVRARWLDMLPEETFAPVTMPPLPPPPTFFVPTGVTFTPAQTTAAPTSAPTVQSSTAAIVQQSTAPIVQQSTAAIIQRADTNEDSAADTKKKNHTKVIAIGVVAGAVVFCVVVALVVVFVVRRRHVQAQEQSYHSFVASS